MSYLSGRTPRDANRTPALFAIDTTTGTTTVPLEANPATGALLVETVASGGSSVNITQVGGSNITLGQKTMANSFPVTLASDQSALPVNQGTPNTVANSWPITVTDLTNTANIALNNSATTGNTGNFLLNGGTGFPTGTLTLNLASPNTIWYDMLNFPWVSLEILTNSSSATLSFQTSGDSSQTNVRSTVLTDSASTGPGAFITSTTTAVASLNGPRTGRYFRISSNVSGANTVTLALVFYTTAPPTNIVGVSNSTGTVSSSTATGSAVPANAFYVGVNSAGNLAGLASPAGDGTSSSGAPGSIPLIFNGTNFDRLRSGGVTGMLGVSPQASASGGYSFSHIAAGQATTTVKSGAGYLHAIVFNGAATATNVTTIYDNTAGSGTVIGIPAVTAVTAPQTVKYDLAFATGLTIVTATANGSDMTVVYK